MSEKAKKKTFKEVCECKNCGNEAEMIFTCSLEEVEEKTTKKVEGKETPRKHKATGVCSHCGSEADMWIDV